MNAHTPGTWTAAVGELFGRIIIGVWATDTKIIAFCGEVDAEDLEESMSNAALIAAAPELLEELENMADRYGCTCGHPHCDRCKDTANAFATIAKAKAEQT